MSIPTHFTPGDIDGVIIRRLKRFADNRGWLTELFRHDELEEDYRPVMSYVSMTLPGVTRGPHEHAEQTDLFAFLGPGTFRVVLWDTRAGSPSYGHRQVVVAGQDDPASILVPPGIVHAYQNIDTLPGLVFNAPNRLYAGWGKSSPVDEIRHEDRADQVFSLD